MANVIDIVLPKRIADPVEPATERRRNYVHTSTPWGTADCATYYGSGIVFYSTPGHGGFHVSAGLLKSMPEYLRTADKFADGTRGWFEEDCGWAIVAICFPDRFSMQNRIDAVRTMQSTYPAQWAKFVSESE
jgi:hypothetical protein